ncbi:MAG: hypothetical protein IKR98_07185, partial [Bacteroidaceae bacterium]|nr:hypothetical protein [Bacteroidaceae bacterium]
HGGSNQIQISPSLISEHKRIQIAAKVGIFQYSAKKNTKKKTKYLLKTKSRRKKSRSINGTICKASRQASALSKSIISMFFA